ncbi:multidrug efflux pump subunit AcrB [Algoriphagus ratkowskyi]|uniref:Efflux RND transporter permease subunit n=1 Tax=Algoriphagus ratkowskyi TaxID=57028 RepID=A0A2W7R4D5_9BACT|nr:efflux RND transporter permease subunit [Algoriphagus ratkowskyi]PZX50717.1 multidrug efflux pump subunit AcrB [Algoriphagus ratkowskyi]TXD75794.1 efflux RND transporter permease subunit [Algoriphagus ratkowskyi]
MVRFLLARPIAVFMTFMALMVFAFIVLRTLPISLLPPIDVPQIVVKVSYPNASPEAIEQNVLSPIREGLITLNGLEEMDSKAGSEVGTIRLTFDYRTKMELAYIDVNEKIDRLTNGLPEDLGRPEVIRINTSDIPVARVQVVPKEGADAVEVSLLTENVLKKRIEQLPGVSLVDINGKKERIITVKPNEEALSALGMTQQNVIAAIQSGNSDLPGISVKDGQFRYYLRLATRVDTPKDIESLPVAASSGVIIPLGKLAEVTYETQETLGFHLFGTKESLVITVHKQASAKMNELIPALKEAIELFKTDYPQVDFEITQDQSNLLNAAISNLETSLLFGGVFAFAVLFLFMKDYRLPLIIGVSLPSSLLISFLIFYFFNLSINIISLSGLALGIGMLIDNAIIVLDNITRKRESGLPLFEACVEGVDEVMGALVSSVLTTLAVFVPLVFLSGISGALFFDQAVAVTAILSVSLAVAFILLPMLYYLLFSRSKKAFDDGEGAFFTRVLGLYEFGYRKITGNRKVAMLLFMLLIPLGLGISLILKTSGLPEIEKLDATLDVDWSEPISAAENRDRVLTLLKSMEGKYDQVEADVGVKQFLLFDGENSIQQSLLYFLFPTVEDKEAAIKELEANLKQNYPEASFTLGDAPNAFDQLFNSNKPFYEVRWKDLGAKEPVPEEKMDPWLSQFPTQEWERGPGLQKEASVVFTLRADKMAIYQVPVDVVQNQIAKLFGTFTITDIRRFGEITPIRLKEPNTRFEDLLRNTRVIVSDSTSYILGEFVEYNYEDHYKYVTADKGGIYQSLHVTTENPDENASSYIRWGQEKNLGVKVVGQYFRDKENIRQLIGILLISVLLLYFILAAQFESFIQPLIVVFTLPLGIGGAFLVLLISGSSLNVMSAIGLVVMLGIMVNDAILKIDTINRLRATYVESDEISACEALEMALHRAGQIRLKPILMTSITTILALIPIVFSSGLGADLQRPLVYAVIGGLTIGTLTALYFVPLAYWFTVSKKSLKAT